MLMVMTQDSINPENNLKKILNKYKNCSITVFHGDDWSILPGQTFMDNHNILISHYNKLSRNQYIIIHEKIDDYQFNNYKNIDKQLNDCFF